MSIQFDTENLEFISAHANENTEIENEFFGTKDTDKGIVLMNWVSGKPILIDDQTGLFYLNFKIKNEGELKDWIQVGDRLLRSEAYNGNNEFLKIGLEFTNERFNVLSNISFSPNPFAQKTQLNIQSQVEENIEVEFFDNTGRRIKNYKVNLQNGMNNIPIDFSNFTYQGVLFYKIQGKNNSYSGKIVKI